MPDGGTTIDVLSLEDFGATLARRLSEVDAMMTKLDELRGKPPKLGTFQDARAGVTQYAWLHDQFAQRLDRLRQAVVATQDATADIIANYRTTEARNAAAAADIANRLGGVPDTLQGWA